MQNVIENKIPRRDGEKHCHIVVQREIENLSILTSLNVTHVVMTLFVYTICSQGLTCPPLFHMWFDSGIQIHLYTSLNVSTLEECKKEVSMECYLFDQFMCV